MSSLHTSQNPINSIYDRWKSFCDIPQDQLVRKGSTLFIGNNCNTQVLCPNDLLNEIEDVVVCGKVCLQSRTGETIRAPKIILNNIYLLGGEFECRGISLTASRILQISKNQFFKAVSRLVNSMPVEPGIAASRQTPSAVFYQETFKIMPNTPLKTLHFYRGLATSAKFGDEPFVKLFIAAGVDLNEGDKPPLCHAAEENEVGVVKLLLEGKALIEKRDSTSSTALLQAVVRNSRESTKELIAQKANVYAKNSFEQTPLTAAASNESVEILQLLVEAGVDISTHIPEVGCFPAEVIYAAGSGDVEKTREFLTHIHPSIENNLLYQRLVNIAARFGQDKVLQLILAEKKDIDVIKPLLESLKNGYIEVTKLLISEDPDAVIDLIMDKFYDHNLVANLLQHADDPLSFSRKVLLEAVINKHSAIVKALLSLGIQVNDSPLNPEQTLFGETVLFRSVIDGEFSTAELLIEAKANIHGIDANGQTLLTHARFALSMRVKTCEFSKGRSGHRRKQIAHRLEVNFLKIFEMLKAAGANDGVYNESTAPVIPNPKPHKSVHWPNDNQITLKEACNFESLSTAKNFTEALKALSDINLTMTERAYGYSCTERLALIDAIKNNKSINIHHPNIKTALQVLKNINKTLPKKEKILLLGQLHRPDSEQKSVSRNQS